MTNQSTHPIMGIELDEGVPTEPVSVETLRSALESDRAIVRTQGTAVASGLAGTDEETVVPVIPTLIDLLSDDQRTVVYQSAMALCQLAEDHADELEPAVERLVELTLHELKLVRLLSARTLGYVALDRPELFTDHVDALLSATATEPEGVVADETLDERVETREMRESFQQVEEEHRLRQTYTRHVTVNLLVEVAEHDPAALEPHVPDLVELLSTDDAEVARGAAEILGLLAREDADGVGAAVDPLLDLLDHPADAVAATAITTLGFVGDPAAAEPLWSFAEGADDDDPDHDPDVYDLAAETADFLDAP